jgi:2-polyprenyl-3-methyl-5-hydroxy-6-metoxy-1,4-benzoquinol methylase
MEEKMAKPFGKTAPTAESDLGSATDDYAARFAGNVGRWMLDVQKTAILPWIEAVPTDRILDVGGAHGQMAVPLARAGRDVTVTGSVPECETWLRSRAGDLPIPFVPTSSLGLPFKDRSFDMALALRMMTHSEDWQGLIAELCRVADRAVIVDYPTLNSVNIFAKLLFGLKKKVERNTRTYRVFYDREIRQAFKRQGFAIKAVHRQFFWPMALHRLFGNAHVSKALNRIATLLGLKRLWGSPVILLAERSHTLRPTLSSCFKITSPLAP